MLGHKVVTCLVFKGTVKLSSRVAAPCRLHFCQYVMFIHNLASISCCHYFVKKFSHSCKCALISHCVLVCIPLMANDVKILSCASLSSLLHHYEVSSCTFYYFVIRLFIFLKWHPPIFVHQIPKTTETRAI